MSLQPQQAKKKFQHNTIRIGLMQVKGLSQGSIGSIIDQQKRQKFVSLEDLLLRTDIGKVEAETLIFCGACDGLGKSRVELIWRCQLFFSNKKHIKRNSFQKSIFFSEVFEPCYNEEDFSFLSEYSKQEKLMYELEYLNFTVSDHVLSLFDINFHDNKLSSSRFKHLVAARDIPKKLNKFVTIVGWLITYKRVRTIKGELMNFITLEDQTGLVEVTLFPKPYKRCGQVFFDRGPFIVKGQVVQKEGCFTVTANWVGRIKKLD